MTAALATKTPHILTDAPKPGSPEHAALISASKVPPMARNAEGAPAGFGYITAWEQYEELKGRFIQDHSDYMLARFEMAHEAEQEAVNWWVSQQENPEEWATTGGEVAYTHPGYTFYGRHPIATLDDVATHLPTGRQVRLEVKNPDNTKVDQGWLLQCIAQEEWSGIPDGELIVWPRYDAPFSFPLSFTREQIQAVMDDVTVFAEMLDNDTEPGGGEHELSDDMMNELLDARQAVIKAEEHLEEVKKGIAGKIGHHKRATYQGKVIATRSAGRFAKTRIPVEYADIANSPEYQTTATKFDKDKFEKDHPDAYKQALGESSFTFK